MKLPSNAFLAGATLAVGAGAVAAIRHFASKSMDGKVVVIAGGSRGLGLALAEEFGRYGARLVLAARKHGELDEARRKLVENGATKNQDQVLAVTCDLRSSEGAQNLIEHATSRFGRVDVLINVAGVIHVGPVEKQSLEMYEHAMASNFFSMLHTTYAVLPQMLQRREGAIVNIASIGGKIPVPHLAPYTASKFAAVGFSETLHAELRSKGILVTTVNPGLMRTGSYPNAIVVGQREKEYRWFRLSASMPGLAHSARYAARKICSAVIHGRAEVDVGLDAYLAARFHGIAPTATQILGSLAERVFLPEAGGTGVPAEGTALGSSEGTWKHWSDKLTAKFNQPPA
jgi:short-subunit dehydrogenase